jgi:capsular polysaccharide biosynthesis protein
MPLLWWVRRKFRDLRQLPARALHPLIRHKYPDRTLNGVICDLQTLESEAAEASLAVEIITPSEAHLFTEAPPEIGVNDTHWRFDLYTQQRQTPPSFIARLSNGHIFGSSGAVATKEMKLVSDLSFETGRAWGGKSGNKHSSLSRLRLPSPTPLPGRTLCTAIPNGDSFHHWLWNMLPRFELVERMDLDLNKFDHIYLNCRNAPYELTAIKRLGLNPEQLIFANDAMHYVCEELIVPSHIPTGYLFPDRAVNYVHNLLGTEPAKNQPRIFIDRQGGRWRRIRNHKEVTTLLEKFGFTALQLENMTIEEQSAAFAGASVIVAVHGAGFANLAFCKQGTRLLEIFSPNYVNLLFWRLAQAAGLRYDYMIGEGPRPPENIDPHSIADNVTVDTQRLKTWLEQL